MTPVADTNDSLTGTLQDTADYAKTMRLTELLVDNLPCLPWYLRELQLALEDGSTDLEAVCKALKAHPAVYENFLRIGAMAEPVQPIRIPVDHLVVMMGKQRVWGAALAAYMLMELCSSWSTPGKLEAGSIGLAQANKALARARMAGDDAPETAYVEGLLSVAGFLPLLEAAGVSDGIPDWLDATKESLHEQREIFGTDFLELNCWIRLLWRLPLVPLEKLWAAEPVPSRPAICEAPVPIGPIAVEAVTRNLVLVSRGVV